MHVLSLHDIGRKHNIVDILWLNWKAHLIIVVLILNIGHHNLSLLVKLNNSFRCTLYMSLYDVQRCRCDLEKISHGESLPEKLYSHQNIISWLVVCMKNDVYTSSDYYSRQITARQTHGEPATIRGVCFSSAEVQAAAYMFDL